MDATRNQSGAPGMLRYEEFEPKFSWTNDKDRETLVLDVPDFKKENLKVQLDNHGRIRISGSRPLEDSKWIRFSKDFQVPMDCNTGGIRAKVDNNRLFVTMPLVQRLQPVDTSREATAEEEKKNKNKTTTTMNTDGNHPAAEVVGGRLKEKTQYSYPTKSKVSNVVVVIILLLLVLGSYIIVQRFMKQPPQQLQQMLETEEEGISNWIARPLKKKEV